MRPFATEFERSPCPNCALSIRWHQTANFRAFSKTIQEIRILPTALYAARRTRLRRIRVVTRKEVSQMLRDKTTLRLLLMMPLIQIILFGFAVSMNVRHIPTVVFDQSRDSASRAYLDSLVNSQYFYITAMLSSQAAIRQAIDNNQAQVADILQLDTAPKLFYNPHQFSRIT